MRWFWTRFLQKLLVTSTIACVPCVLLAQTPPEQPEAHAAPEYPGFRKVSLEKRRAINVGSGPSFATMIHVQLVENSPESLQCTEVLGRAQWRQDILLALDATAHYDNCQFDNTTAYIQKLVREAMAAGKRGDRDGALAALGRALHAIQDFYAHSNYVELSSKKYAMLADVPIVPVWNDQGVPQLSQQVAFGLVSGNVWWEPGKACKAPSSSHAELNKDTPDSSSGKEIVAKWNLSQHQAARELARRATLEFLRDLFSRPDLKNVAIQCKGNIGVLLLTDNRTGP